MPSTTTDREETAAMIEHIRSVIELLEARTDGMDESLSVLANTFVTIANNHKLSCKDENCELMEHIHTLVEAIHDAVILENRDEFNVYPATARKGSH